MIEADFRLLTDAERATLDFLLTAPIADVGLMRAQAATASARRICDCGCPTIALRVRDDAPTPRLTIDHQIAVAESQSLETSPAHPALLLLFVKRGRLDELELTPMDPGRIAAEFPPTPTWREPAAVESERADVSGNRSHDDRVR